MKRENRKIIKKLDDYESFKDKAEKLSQLDIANILFSKYDLSTIKLVEIINSSRLQSLMDDFYELTGIGMSIIDMEGNLLVRTGWEEICTKFHRVHPETEKRCIESDTQLTQDIEPGEYMIYRCKNNMWDIATPIIVGDIRVGTVFTGQFFFKDDEIEREFFIKQAEKYGFDKEKYLSALEKVRRWSKETVETAMRFLTKFASLVSELGYKNFLLERLVKDQRLKEQRLEKSEKKLKGAVKQAEFYKDLLAHDIANKLSNVYSSAQLMDMFEDLEENMDKVDDLIATIKEEVQEGKRIISNVRKLSKIKEKKGEIKPVKVNKVLQSAIKHAKVRVQRRNSEITTNFPAKDIIVQGGDLLIDAFENILINGAIHNDSEMVKLWIEMSIISGSDTEKVKIEFKDNGVGIPDEQKKKLFQKTYETSSGAGGMGIGLSLVKNIIDTYDGEIWVEDRIEGNYSEGSNFVVLLKKN